MTNFATEIEQLHTAATALREFLDSVTTEHFGAHIESELALYAKRHDITDKGEQALSWMEDHYYKADIELNAAIIIARSIETTLDALWDAAPNGSTETKEETVA